MEPRTIREIMANYADACREAHARCMPCPPLPDVQLDGADLSGMDFRRTDLRGASLRVTNLSHSILDYASLEGANLYCAKLRGAILSNAGAYYASFRGAVLEGASMHDANMHHAIFLGAMMRDVSASRANLADAVLDEADLQGACLRSASLDSASLRDVQWAGADLEYTDLTMARGLPLRDDDARRALRRVVAEQIRQRPSEDLALDVARMVLESAGDLGRKLAKQIGIGPAVHLLLGGQRRPALGRPQPNANVADALETDPSWEEGGSE